MKKILILSAFLIFSSTAYAGNINVGFTGSYMKIDAGGDETEAGTATKTNSDSEKHTGSGSNEVIIASVYAEYAMEDASWAGEGNGITFGLKHIPGSADVSDSTKSRTDTAGTPGTDDDTGTRSANAEVENYLNYYLELPVTGSWFVKLGHSEIDVNTKESSTATNGSAMGTYGNTTLDGLNYGVGVKGVTGNNLAWKVAYEEVDFDQLSLTSTTGNILKADLDTKEINFSLGYQF